MIHIFWYNGVLLFNISFMFVIVVHAESQGTRKSSEAPERYFGEQCMRVNNFSLQRIRNKGACSNAFGGSHNQEISFQYAIEKGRRLR